VAYICGFSSLTDILALALDLRSLQKEFLDGLTDIATEEFSRFFGQFFVEQEFQAVLSRICRVMQDTFEATSTMDAPERMEEVASSTTVTLVDSLTTSSSGLEAFVLKSIPDFRYAVSSRAAALLDDLRRDYLSGARGAAPASRYLNKTRPIYEFVRVTLGIRMHGSENYSLFANGLGVDDVTVGQDVSLVHEVCRL